MTWDSVSRWLRRRPLTLAALSLTAGMLLGRWQIVPWPLWLAGALACATAGLALRRAAFVYLCVALLGAMLMTRALIRPPLPEMGRARLTGRLVDQVGSSGSGERFLLDQAQMDDTPLPGRVMVYAYGGGLPPMEYGDTLAVEASLYLPASAGNPGGYDFSAYLWRRGAAVAASAPASGVELISRGPFSLPWLLLRWRAALEKAVYRSYPPETAPLVCALLLGERSRMSGELRDSFRKAGVAHLLAVSGLHITCLAFALEALLKRVRCPNRLSFFLILGLLSLYALVIGLPISVLRAILMYAMTSGGRLLSRPSDRLTRLSAALIVLLAANPLSLEDPALILSFSSVAGIILLARLREPDFPSRVPLWLDAPLRWIRLSLLASLTAQLGSLPAMACLFGEIPAYALLANLLAIPLMTVALPLAMLSLGLELLFPLLGGALSPLVSGGLTALIRFAGWVANLPFASVSTPAWPPGLILLYALTALLASPVCSLRGRWRRLCMAGLPALALCALALPLTYPTDGLEILFLDVGQGDGALLRAQSQYYLVDAGPDSAVADYLRHTGVHPRAVFLSHPHLDHAGGLGDVVELCPPGVIYLPCLWDEVPADPGVPEMVDQARRAGWRVEYLQAGDTLTLSPQVSLRVLQPWPGQTDNANGASLTMRVSLGEGSALFTGDLPSSHESCAFPHCDVLKVAHHGASASTSQAFLEMTSPKAAVISVGRNSYGHPAPDTMRRLAGAAIFRTDQCGAVRVSIAPDGEIQVTPMRSPGQEAQSEREAAA